MTKPGITSLPQGVYDVTISIVGHFPDKDLTNNYKCSVHVIDLLPSVDGQQFILPDELDDRSNDDKPFEADISDNVKPTESIFDHILLDDRVTLGSKYLKNLIEAQLSFEFDTTAE